MERTIPRQVSLNSIRKVDDRWRHMLDRVWGRWKENRLEENRISLCTCMKLSRISEL